MFHFFCFVCRYFQKVLIILIVCYLQDLQNKILGASCNRFIFCVQRFFCLNPGCPVFPNHFNPPPTCSLTPLKKIHGNPGISKPTAFKLRAPLFFSVYMKNLQKLSKTLKQPSKKPLKKTKNPYTTFKKTITASKKKQKTT